MKTILTVYRMFTKHGTSSRNTVYNADAVKC